MNLSTNRKETAMDVHAEQKLGDDTDSETAGLSALGYQESMQRRRGLFTLLFQAIAIAAVPYGEGSSLIFAIYGGGQLAIFVGWIVVCLLDQAIAVSLAEISSRYPTAAGVHYWSFQLAHTESQKVFLSFITGWIWVIGNWTVTLSVNFGAATLVSGTVAMYHPDFEPTKWQLILIFWAFVLGAFFVCVFGNKHLAQIDTICATWSLLSVVIICIALWVEADAGRHSASYSLSHFDSNLSGWGNFSFFIGLLPAAYVFSAIGMISSMAEEVAHPATQMPKAIAWTIPVCGVLGLLYVVPICVTLPPLAPILDAPAGQALPYVFNKVMSTHGGALGLMFLVLAITCFCSISITTAATRTTWAFARDKAIPFPGVFSRIWERFDLPFFSLLLITVVEMLLGLIYIGSTEAFEAFISVAVFALALSYGVPISLSLLDRRRQIQSGKWVMNNTLGYTCNIIALLWIALELILFSMPTALPTTPAAMNYASVVFFGFFSIAIVYWFVRAKNVYIGPPKSAGL